MRIIFASIIALLASVSSFGQKVDSDALAAFSFRNIGPANTSGRISSIAVNEQIQGQYFVGVASGGVWRTNNWGTTYEPIFDQQGSYSIGTVVIDPSNPRTIWVGTGENNNQRSVAYGDGVYVSFDGGDSWSKRGLEKSEHIARIIVDPNNSKHIYVAAYGPLWSKGGERGVYESFDQGETWTSILSISENTGISDLVMDPTNPQIMYAAAHQRRRHVWTYIDGGPETAIYKTEDGGKNWIKLEAGLPSGSVGRIGLAIAPSSTNVVYAIINGGKDVAGFYRSENAGASWHKQSGYKSSGNYYQEIYVDPKNPNKVFSMNTWLHHTEDGGKTFKRTGESQKHVDNHAIWINPNNTNHWLVGCDGGMYETWDHATTWQFKPNLPIVQFYKVAIDYAKPFYNIYGGTQDNNSMGGPSQTINNAGILNSDWYITNGGDGFESQVDPKDPNIVYAQSQYGWLVRYDKKSGEKIGIQPQPAEGEMAFRWNWDAPLLISPHDNKTLYFCANKVFKSTDQGNTWTTISGDLSRQLDRNKIPVMGRVWSFDAPMKNQSTTIYGNIVAFDESPVKKGLLYAGTDDGLIQVSEDDGAQWQKITVIQGVPEKTYVNAIYADKFDENVVYAVFNNHKNGDFKPYIFMSSDKGKSWLNISEGLPVKGSTYCMAQDHKNKDLLFVGTEFGVYISFDGGLNWNEFSRGLPTIAIRDMDIQKRENDLVLASFGRGFYVLDNYAPLRDLTESNLKRDAYLFDTKDALQYQQSNPLGLRGVGSQGASMYAAKNPEFGATFTYYLKDDFTSMKDARKKKEADNLASGADNMYPSIEAIKAEQEEKAPKAVLVIKDRNGFEVRRIVKSWKKGTNRVTWNLRKPSTSPIKLSKGKVGRYSNPDEGAMVLPGDYTVQLYKLAGDELVALTDAKTFKVRWLQNMSIPNDKPLELESFEDSLYDLYRRMEGISEVVETAQTRLKYLQAAAVQYPGVDMSYLTELGELKGQIDSIEILLYGDPIYGQLQMEGPVSIYNRIGTAIYQLYGSRSLPTSTQKNAYAIGKKEFEPLVPAIQEISDALTKLEEVFSALNVPFTKARQADWKEE